MKQLQQNGKIRYWGVSLNTFDPFPEAEFFMQQQLGHGFQLVLNMLNQKASPLVEKVSKAGYGIIARMPLQFGLLTGKFDDGVSFPENDHRKNRVTTEIIEATNRALAPAWELCHKYGISKTGLALSYILSYAEVSTVIPGIRTTSHAEKNVSGIVQLSAEDRNLIEQLGAGPLTSVMDLLQKQG